MDCLLKRLLHLVSLVLSCCEYSLISEVNFLEFILADKSPLKSYLISLFLVSLLLSFYGFKPSFFSMPPLEFNSLGKLPFLNMQKGNLPVLALLLKAESLHLLLVLKCFPVEVLAVRKVNLDRRLQHVQTTV